MLKEMIWGHRCLKRTGKVDKRSLRHDEALVTEVDEE